MRFIRILFFAIQIMQVYTSALLTFKFELITINSIPGFPAWRRRGKDANPPVDGQMSIYADFMFIWPLINGRGHTHTHTRGSRS